ncbi:hypothetical protein ACFXOM_28010 [Streptomyces sp. NPDC059169]|uniref:hypothetical protein n=1 Tax=Streptomyces sp. NPDC059169 TaxID=3346754 RepID=UPI003682F442
MPRRPRLAVLAILLATVAALAGSAAVPAAAAPAPAPADQSAIAQPPRVRPDLNGLRIKDISGPAIYLVLDGKRRHVPNPETYNNLFRDWNGIQHVVDAAAIDNGDPLSDGAFLGKAPNAPEVYLVSNGVKRWITSPAAMDKYHFAWNRIASISPVALHAIPTGASIS